MLGWGGRGRIELMDSYGDEASSSPVHSERVQRSDGLFNDEEPNNTGGHNYSDEQGGTGFTGDENGGHDGRILMETKDDIVKVDMKNLSPHNIMRYDFISVDIAYKFYKRYARVTGFAPWKGCTARNKRGEVIKQTFLWLWYATVFDDAHNHGLHDELFTGMLAAHREIGEADVDEMNAMRCAGIGPSEIYGLFATQSGGYEKIGYRKKDLYNQIGKQRRMQSSDAKGALEYLCTLGESDPVLFFCFTIDDGDFLDDLVRRLGLGEHRWVQDVYAKRHSWAAAYIRGTFYAGLRTTSRCESLHAEMKRFIKSSYNLTDFIQHFDRLLNYMRHKELECDFDSCNGERVLQTNFDSLERSGEKQFTKDIFMLFRKVLNKACRYNVVRSREMASYSVYTVSKSVAHDKEWHVSFNPPIVDLSCSCHMMESFGLPCHHIICVLGYLGISELPKCLVLDRWTKMVNHALRAKYVDEAYQHAKQVVLNEVGYLRSLKARQCRDTQHENEGVCGDVQDPISVRSKGCGPITSAGTRRSRKRNRCSHCHVSGHNRRSCDVLRQRRDGGNSVNGSFIQSEEEDIPPPNGNRCRRSDHLFESGSTSYGVFNTQ
ncbi:Zinc finger, PMZ-type [Sesbania bispinosa]|nr:Zinc finger, PMZ-type [Sesbania bispinosa]